MAFRIVRNDITKMKVDAIVNTANPKPTYGSGIDTAVYKAAGEEKLLQIRAQIGAVEPGHSFLTDGLKLPAKNIIHTVGTSWRGGTNGEEDILRQCYRSIWAIAIEEGFESIALPLLASGSYGFPKGIALRIALSEIEDFVSVNDVEVDLVVWDEKSYILSSELYGDIDSYINDNYIEAAEEQEYRRRHDDDLIATGSALSPRKPFFGHKPGGKKAHKNTAAESVSAPLESKPAEELQEESFETFGMPAQRSLDEVINDLDKTFMEMVYTFSDRRGITDAELQKKAQIDRKAYSKLKCGTTKNPSKSTALALAVGLELSLDETKDLLSRAGYALSPCSKQDIIVKYFIENEAYSITDINYVLDEHHLPLLGSQAM